MIKARNSILTWLVILLVAMTALAGPYPDSPPKEKAKTMTPNYLQETFKTIDGHDTTLAAFAGKAVLIVNVASKCGSTPQYKGLEELYQKYKSSGLVVVGFPANNFGKQEPGTNAEIKTFCETKYAVTFPMMAKVSVKGEDIHPLFDWLTTKSPLPGEIKWNFSKFLLDKDGRLVARFPTEVEPLDSQITSKVSALLK